MAAFREGETVSVLDDKGATRWDSAVVKGQGRDSGGPWVAVELPTGAIELIKPSLLKKVSRPVE